MKQSDLWIVFDLGGVLFDFHGVHGLADITGRSYDTIHASLKHSPACRLFESGKVGGDEFAVLLREELALEMPPAELLERWVGWLGGSKDGAVEVLGEVRAIHNTACLTNTNELHWQGLTGIHGVARLFDRTFASHQIGHWKPDPEIFAHVAEALERSASSISTTTSTSSTAPAPSAGMRTRRWARVISGPSWGRWGCFSHNYRRHPRARGDPALRRAGWLAGCANDASFS